jgi:allene oxide cyclase-like protein
VPACPVGGRSPRRGVARSNRRVRRWADDDRGDLGARVGSDHGRFTYTSTHSASYAGEASLPGGTVTVRGAVLVRADGQLVIPVVGGSGKYKGVSGFVTIGPGKKRALNPYELTMPRANVA